MSQFKDKNVLITGGGLGIGKIMVRLMLERKAHVVIWDINQDNIDQTLSEFSGLGKLTAYQVDVSKQEEVHECANRVKQEVGHIHALINNAGIVVGKYFHEHTTQDINKTMEINANAPMHIIKEFLGDMMEKKSGSICNIASSAGLISNPKMSVYAASKWALAGFSDSLRLEMEQLNKNIHVTTIMPFYINTGMFDGVKSKIPILEPESAAKSIIKAMEKNKKIVTLPGYIYRVTRLAQALFPFRFYDWFTGDVLGIYKTMENFTGRK